MNSSVINFNSINRKQGFFSRYQKRKMLILFELIQYEKRDNRQKKSKKTNP